MIDKPESPGNNAQICQRIEQQCLNHLPAVITPLRFRIFLGYLTVTVIGLIGWKHIEFAWQYLAAVLAPVGALLGALLALKLGVVVVTLFTLITSLLKVFSGFLMVVLKPGILKAIFMPPLMSLLKWIHRKSSRLQMLANRLYDKLKNSTTVIIEWWRGQSILDKILLSGFLIPLLIIVLVIFLIQRATATFAIKKLTEQLVQATTKFAIKHFHRIPLVGGLPAYVSARAKRLTRQEDRSDLAQDLKNLGSEIYPHNNRPSRTSTDIKTDN